jgi:polar amino acid transport system substrate-binding protein
MLKRIFALLCFLSSTLGHANSITPIEITAGEWPPFISQSQKHNGFIADLITNVFKAADYQANFTFYPWNRAYKTAALGRADATGVWMFKKEREKDFYYSDPVLNEEFVFFKLKSSIFDWQSLEDLSAFKLGGLLGSSYGPAFDDALAKNQITAEFVPDTKLNFLNLLAGRVDAFPLERSVGLASMRELLTPAQQAQIDFHPKRLLQNHSYLLLPKSLANSQNVMIRFNQNLAEFRKDGRYQAYFDRFESGEYELNKTKTD